MDRPKKWILAGVAFLAAACIITHQTQLLECVTDSLTGVRYILVLKEAGFKRGDIVSIKGHQVAYACQENFAKRVLGLPGDQISYDQDTLHIGQYHLSLMAHSHEGKPLTPLTAQSVPQGYVYSFNLKKPY